MAYILKFRLKNAAEMDSAEELAEEILIETREFNLHEEEEFELVDIEEVED